MLDKYDYSYNYERSIIHRVSPVIKFISLIVYIIICFLPYNNYLFIILLTYVFMLLLFSNIRTFKYLKILWKFKLIFLIMFFYMYSKDFTMYNMLIIYFKVIFLILHFFLIILTCTKNDFVTGITWIIDRFNIVGIRKKKIFNLIDKIYNFYISFITNFNDMVKYRELNGINYIYSDLIIKTIFIIYNFKLVFNKTCDSIKIREDDKKYRLFDVNSISKYKYVNKLCFVDYCILLINVGMIIFYVMKVR